MQSVIRFDLETINNERSCTRTNKILKEFSHPNNRQRPLLRLAKRSRSLEANTERMRRSGFLKARNHDILYLSSWTHPLTAHCFTPAVSTQKLYYSTQSLHSNDTLYLLNPFSTWTVYVFVTFAQSITAVYIVYLTIQSYILLKCLFILSYLYLFFLLTAFSWTVVQYISLHAVLCTGMFQIDFVVKVNSKIQEGWDNLSAV